MMRRALRYADKVGAPYKAKVALLEALTQESEFKNLSTPSADGYGSYGVLQGLERYHGKKNLMNPEYQFAVFLGRSKKWRKGFTGKGNAVELAKRGMKSGDIAQAVEGSAYPDRYQTSQKEVMRNIRRLRAADGQPAQRGTAATGTTPPAAKGGETFDAEGYDAARRKAIGMQLLAQKNPNSILVKTGVLDGTPPDPEDFKIAQRQATKTRPATGGTAPTSPRPGGAGTGGTVPGASQRSPVPGQPFHSSTHPTAGLAGYPAYDYMAPAGKSVVAPVSGKVIKLSGRDPKLGGAPGGPLGYSVYIRGDDGKTYFLTHIDRVRPKVGQRVRQGQKIAVIANGPSSWSSPHVHMGVHG